MDGHQEDTTEETLIYYQKETVKKYKLDVSKIFNTDYP